MKKEILINYTTDEIKIALLEDGRLAEFFLDRPGTVGRSNSKKIVGNIYLGRIDNIVSGIQSAFVSIGLKKNAYLPFDEILPSEDKLPIEQRLRKGDTVLVQIVKEPLGSKGAKVSQYISFPGRYLVYLPLERKRQILISRQISDREERAQLKRIVQNLSVNSGSVIIRTEAEGVDRKDLLTDFEYLHNLWSRIQIRQKEITAPNLIHQEIGLVYQVLRDLFTEEVVLVLIDSHPLYKDVLDYVQIISPELKSRVQYYSNKTPIFTAYKLEEEIKQIYQPKVKLPSGGYIIIQETESLCAIDVNTGKYTGETTFEETALLTNLEAVKEIVRHIRLRNIGGIIVIDFIGLKKISNRQKVYHTLTEAIKTDKAKIKILPFNRFGLVEMTRERKRGSLFNLLTDECSECRGSGRIFSRESLYFKIKKEIVDLKNSLFQGRVQLRLHPDLMNYFQTYKEKLEQLSNQKIELISDLRLKRDDYQIVLSTPQR